MKKLQQTSVLPKAEVFIRKRYGFNTALAMRVFKALPYWKYAYRQNGRMEITMGKDYMFSGENHKSVAWDERIKLLMGRINAEFNIDMNSAYLNYYPHGKDSLGYHTDMERQVDYVNQPVVAISYGATRNIWFKDKVTGEEFPIELEDGDLLIMSTNCQEHYQHAIKAEPQRKDDARISITFRHLMF